VEVVGEVERERKVFPQTHTCVTINIPFYTNYTIFRDRMDEAVVNGNAITLVLLFFVLHSLKNYSKRITLKS
jgi:hypothetical protein